MRYILQKCHWSGLYPGLLLITSILAVAACSSHRYRYRDLQKSQIDTRRTETDSIYWYFRSGQEILRLTHDKQQALIWPKGPFRFRSDSGFSGEALAVWIDYQRLEASSDRDSVAVGMVYLHRNDSTIRQQDHVEVTRSEMKRDWLSGGKAWAWGFVLLLLVYLALLLRKVR